MTNLQILVEGLLDNHVDQLTIDDLILEEFNNQNSDEYTVEDTTYLVIPSSELQDILFDQELEKLKPFSKYIKNNFPEYDIFIDYDLIAREKAVDSSPDELVHYSFFYEYRGKYVLKEK